MKTRVLMSGFMILLCVAVTAVAAEPGADNAGAASSKGQASGEVRMAFNPGSVAKAVITTGVKDRKPVDHVDVVSNNIDRVYFFTDLRDMTGQHVIHRWMYNGKVMAQVGFDVRGPRWRVWSSKHMLPSWLGTWTVQVVNVAGNVVSSRSFTYAKAPSRDSAQ